MYSRRALLLGPLLLLIVVGCAQRGLLDEEASDALRPVERTLPDTIRTDSTTTFLALGDTQGSWRAEHKFYRADWWSWKQALVPFYQLYLFGNGLVGGINYLRNQPDLGATPRAAVRTALREEWTASPSDDPRFVVHLGDMVAGDGRYPSHWTRFLEEYGSGEQSLLRRTPVLPTIGNHEVANDTSYGWPNYDAVFDYDRFYVVDLPHAALIVMDSNRLVDMAHQVDEDRQEHIFRQWFVGDADSGPSWLERVLAARSDRPFKIVAIHHPLLTLSFHDKDWYSEGNGPALPAKRKALLETLREHGVQLVLSGHEHLYEHNRLRYEADGETQGLHQIISSGGGAVVRPPGPTASRTNRLDRYHEQGIDLEPVTHRSVYHYTRLTVNADSLRINTLAVDVDSPREPKRLERITLTPEGTRLRPSFPPSDSMSGL